MVFGNAQAEAPTMRGQCKLWRREGNRPYLLFGRVLFGAEKVKRDVRLIADDPAIVRDGRNVEKIAGFELDHSTIIERNCCSSGKDKADVFDRATRRADTWTDVLAPFPTGFVGCTPNCHPADVHELEFPFFHYPHFIRRLEPFQNHADFFATHFWLCLTRHKIRNRVS
jgi:hypothetical protein